MPGFDESLRQAILEVVRSAGFHPLPYGVYANARGPRFETKSEIRMMADYCDVVGMTSAHETVACCEVGLPYAILAMVDNYANGIGGVLTLEAFHQAQAENLAVLEQCVASLLRDLPGRSELPHAAASPAAAADTSLGSPTPSGAVAMPKAPRPVDLIVHARWVVPCAPQAGREQEVLDRHSVVVKDGIILDIVPSAQVAKLYSAAKSVTLDAEHALMPGFVNAHTHMAMNLMKGLADDLPLAQWLSEQIWPVEGRLVQPDFVKAGTKAALAELIRTGVTTVSDMYWFPSSIAEAVHEVGSRAVLAMIAIEFPSAYASGPDEYLAKGQAVRDAWMGKANGRISFAVGPHAPYTVTDATLEKVKKVSESTGCPVHIHLHETAGEVLASKTGGKEGTSKHLSDQLTSPLANLERLGLLNRKLIAVHMTCLTDEEISKVAASGASVVHCPHSNLKLASGFCPVSKLLGAGVNVALGTDSCASNNSLDFFAEMKTAAILAKGVASDATAVPAWQALRMATLNGAKALGLDHVVGSLEVGKKADLTAVRLGTVESLPMFNVLSHLVYASNRSAVTDVWVDGVQLLADRQLTTINEEALLASVREWAGKVKPGGTAYDTAHCIHDQYRAGAGGK